MPLGRYLTTFEEIHERYVESVHNSRRETIWDDFQNHIRILNTVIPICSVWISGSFVSARETPSDIDIVYILKNADIQEALKIPQASAILIDISENKFMERQMALIDVYILDWTPNPLPSRPPHTTAYYELRGYWDELWSRRYTVKGEIHSEDALIRHGYLEVIIDGFNV